MLQSTNSIYTLFIIRQLFVKKVNNRTRIKSPNKRYWLDVHFCHRGHFNQRQFMQKRSNKKNLPNCTLGSVVFNGFGAQPLGAKKYGCFGSWFFHFDLQLYTSTFLNCPWMKCALRIVHITLHDGCSCSSAHPRDPLSIKSRWAVLWHLLPCISFWCWCM